MSKLGNVVKMDGFRNSTIGRRNWGLLMAGRFTHPDVGLIWQRIHVRESASDDLGARW